MKKLLFFAPLLLAASVLQAQSDCSKDHPIYKVDMTGSPKMVYALGADPEFPFLRNLSSPKQVVAAMNSTANAKKYPGKWRN